MTPLAIAAHSDCQHTERLAEIFLGSYFVKCASCKATLITIPWFSAELLLGGTLAVHRAQSSEREKVAEGPADHLVPQIREMLGERLLLVGPNAVIDESQLGEIKNNSLEVQREYFSRLIAENHRGEEARFALAQVLRELGAEREAIAQYDAGISVANRNWLRKLPFFAVPSIVVAAIMWEQSFARWLTAIVAVAGPAVWLFIGRNRQRWLPHVGIWWRAATTATVDMNTALQTRDRLGNDVREQ